MKTLPSNDSSHITPEALPSLKYHGVPVITTEALAVLYSADVNRIKVNHSRNSHRFVSGKHYYKLEGEALRTFKNRVTKSNPVAFRCVVGKNARSLLLWTERGAARHAKMLETEQAWDVFEKLEECYFRQSAAVPTATASTDLSLGFIDDRRVAVEGMTVTQLNALFSTVEYLQMEMWPHLMAVFPHLNQRYIDTFVTLRSLMFLMRELRNQCRQEAERQIYPS
ncbi:ORF6N domain-containing protein [Dickeya oryzae]|uniref:ORF6N domain-containing protein n=1 Tax=Dickeya oryzae TaxID=1240404 RepID=UPI001AEC7873|nr:ORF6N domain-containing protein [Dickeya oryzae]MBP2844088.1 ORF6N domain-containing protein [Dickeya oryzae]